MNKVCLITHIADADGAFAIILAKLHFSEIDVFSCECEVQEVDKILKEVINSQMNYAKIFIVDVNISESMANLINQDNILKQKVIVFDHHISNMNLNAFSFIKVIDFNEGRKECGTSLFYDYLKKESGNSIFLKDNLKTMVELVRQADTYDFTEELKKTAFQFGSLYSIYGRERYIEHFWRFILENDTFFFSELEKQLLILEEEKTTRYIEEKLQNVIIANLLDTKVGIVFAEQKRSLLGHAMVEKLDIDIAIVINVDRSISFRASKEEVDVTKMAKVFGGGGHKHASGSPLPENLQKRICEFIFKNIKWI